jgi:hypothetical protein
MHVITVVERDEVVGIESHPKDSIVAAALKKAADLKDAPLNIYERESLLDNWNLRLNGLVRIQIHKIENAE